MQDTGIKLDRVATDTMGEPGRAMLDALVSATVLADLARGQLGNKLPALRAALEGRFDAEHVLVVGRILAHTDPPGGGHRRAVSGDRGATGPVRAGG